MNGNDLSHPFSVLKLRIYQWALLAGTVTVATVWLVSGIGDQYFGVDSFVQPVVTFFCMLSIILFWKFKTRYIRIFEITIYSIVFAYFIAHIAYTFWDGIIASPQLEFQKFLLWIPLIYALSFLFFPARRAFQLSIIFLVSVFCMSAVYIYLVRGTPHFWDNSLILIEMYASSVVYTVLFYIISVLKDRFTEAEIRSELMTTLATIDPLTGVYNRRKINDLLEYYIDHRRDQSPNFSAVMIDVDNFKIINDTFGHDVGDYVLRHVIDLVSASVRENDHVGRWGGDEFFILCPGTDDERVKHLIDRLDHAVSSAVFNHVGRVTLSFGAATYRPGDTTDSLLKRADSALYENKKAYISI